MDLEQNDILFGKIVAVLDCESWDWRKRRLDYRAHEPFENFTASGILWAMYLRRDAPRHEDLDPPRIDLLTMLRVYKLPIIWGYDL